MRYRRLLRWFAIFGVIALLAAACGEAGSGDGDGDTEGEAAEQEESEAAQGGTLVAAAEQEPACLDALGVCNNLAWGNWAGTFHLMARPFDLTDWEYVPNPIMEDVELDTGPPMTVTYRFNPDARWSDGEPITSDDLVFSLDEILNGPEVRVKDGYDLIESIETPDEQTAIATFSEPYALWQRMFGIDSNAILPQHILEDENRVEAMQDGFDWSGGPWLLEEWARGESITFVPNPEWVGPGPNLDQVVFRFIEDTSAQMQAFQTGQVSIMAPQQQIGMDEQLDGLENAEVLTSSDLINFEMLWFNTSVAPLDSLDFRKAIAYAVDREAIVEQISHPLDPEAPVLQSPAVPGTGAYSEAFAMYEPDPAMVEQHMTTDGWTMGDDGFWQRDGERASVEIHTTAGNESRELIEQLIQGQLREAGIELVINNNTPAVLFGEWLPTARHQIGMYAWSDDHVVFCNLFCNEQIPTDENQRTGNNYTYLESEAIDAAFQAAIREPDEDARNELLHEAHAALAEELPVLPIYVKIETVAYDSTVVTGPIKTDPTLKTYWNMYEWSLVE